MFLGSQEATRKGTVWLGLYGIVVLTWIMVLGKVVGKYWISRCLPASQEVLFLVF
jgi:hypothetical protein